MTYFFGHQRGLAKALNLLRHGQSISVIGPRHIGKTSFLNDEFGNYEDNGFSAQIKALYRPVLGGNGIH